MQARHDKGRDVEAPALAIEVESVTCRFGQLVALNSVSIGIRSGSVTALIGPNGAGKTTLLNVVSGLIPAGTGKIRLNGRDISDLPVPARARAGIARSFQTPRLLERETVLTNIVVGCEPLGQPGLLRELAWLPSVRKSRARDRAAGQRTLREMRLLGVADRPVEELPFAIRRLVEIGRALASDPDVLLLDEPAAGLESAERSALAEVIAGVMDARDMTVVVIEHDVAFVAKVAEEGMALDAGSVVATGPIGDVLASPAVRSSFFGETPSASA